MTGSVIPSLMFTLHIELEGSKKGQNIPSTPLFLTDSNTAKDKHGNTTNGMMSQICINTYGKILENQEEFLRGWLLVTARTLKMCYSTLGNPTSFDTSHSPPLKAKRWWTKSQTATGLLLGMSCRRMWTAAFLPQWTCSHHPQQDVNTLLIHSLPR